MSKVEIYTTSNCQYCKAAKDFFEENDIEYEEHNVEKDVEKRQEMVAETGQLSVPVIRIGESTVVGFDKGKVSELLGVPA